LRLTVVVPTYNRSDLLGETLRKLLHEQSASADDYEIVVVDDGSTDETPSVVAAVGAPESRLRYYRQENRGPAAARNLGTREAKGKIILFTGDDCIPERGLILAHLQAHERTGDVGVVGHVAWHPDLEMTPLMLFLDHGVQFGFTYINDPENVTFWTFYTANCSIQRHWLEEAGGFDEDFRHAAYEDIELAYRMMQRGLRIVYRRAALTYHHHAPSLDRHLARTRLCGRAAVTFWRKHSELKKDLGIIEAARAVTVNSFFEAATSYAHALGVRDALKGELPPPEEELGALTSDADLAGAGRAWVREAFGDLDPDKGEMIKIRREMHLMREEFERVTSRRLYRASEWMAKAGWKALRLFGLGRGAGPD
jgi:GT2 family glycosyltransferase